MTVLLAVAFSVASVAVASAGVQTISNCKVIDDPGSYQLNRVITATDKDLIPGALFPACILIEADFVTLDLAGFTIIGPGAGSIGIASLGDRRSVKIHSGMVTNFQVGVLLTDSGHTVEQVSAIGHTATGIIVGLALGSPSPLTTGHRVVGNVANDNGIHGIDVQCPSVVLGNMAKGNAVEPQIRALGTCTRLENSPVP